MGACKRCGFVSGKKRIDIKPCLYCGFYNEPTEKIEDKRLEISGSKTINTRNIKNWL